MILIPILCRLWIAAGTALGASLTAAIASETQPLNIVLLYADDWRFDTLGCAGNEVVKTPQLDELARQGIRFTHNCVTTSICGVSRATLLTGQWMSRHGNRAFAMFDTPWAETYPALLRAHNYYVGHVGKWHNGPFPGERFDYGRAYFGKHWLELPDGSLIHVTNKNELDAIAFLRERPLDRPFCLTVAFFATHAEDRNPKQYLPQPESMTLYQDVTIPPPATGSDEHFRKLPPFLADEKNEGRHRWHWRFDTPQRYQESLKNYYRMASEVDAACGRVIAELKRQGQWDRTLVAFTTDNGYFHGEHGLADKWYPYEESIRVPLIVHDPRMDASRAGGTDDRLTLNVDLAPTILAAAGVRAPPRMQGRDLAPLYLDDRDVAWRTEFYYEHPTIDRIDFIPSSMALVRKDVKYIRWPDFEYEQLFDLRADPREEHDVAREPSHAGRLAALRERFAELQTAAQ